MEMTAENAGALRGLADVEYDFGVSAAVAGAFKAASLTLREQRGGRTSARDKGREEFRGFYADLYIANGSVQIQDMGEIGDFLMSVSRQIERVDQAAREENARRRQAREWAQRQANRNLADHIVGIFTGGEDPPFQSIDTASRGPATTVPARQPHERQPLSGSGGDGTTSAIAANLRSFASSTRGMDGAVRDLPGKLQGHTEDFAASCRWATLDASSVISALRAWVAQNEQDARWADVVADAFEAAGSEGVMTLPDATIDASLRNAGVSQARADLQVDPPSAFGSPPTTGYADDPVNTASGGFVEFEVDVSFAGRAQVASWKRAYSSLNPDVGAFGVGWSSWADAGLSMNEGGARLRLMDGRVISFPRDGTGWGRATGESLWLHTAGGAGQADAATDATTDADAQLGAGFVVSSPWGLRGHFDASGRVVSWCENGTTLRFSYGDDGSLEGVTTEAGRGVRLVWNSGRITEVVASDGRRAKYSYDEGGRLTRVDGPGGRREYHYGASGLIERVVDGDGVVEVDNTFDDSGRVAFQTSPLGRRTKYAYIPGGITVTSDEDATRANTWIHDGRGRLLGIIDADGRRQSMSYDRWGNTVLVRGRDGRLEASEYDDRGRPTQRKLTTGARLAWTWDSLDRLTELRVLSAPDATPAVTHFEYEGEATNPSVVVDAEGGVTRMEWDGPLLARVVDPTGVEVRFAYDAFGDLISTTDAYGATARLERDEAGRIVAAMTPMGHRTTFTYDGAGNLVARRAPDGGITRWEYTAGGRLAAEVDAEGGRTLVEHDESGQESATIDPLGGRLEKTWDDLGNLASVSLPDGSTWQLTSDANSRLTEITDPTGAQWSMTYGPTGTVLSVCDPLGQHRVVERNGQGQPTAVFDGDETIRGQYDTLGRLLSITGSDGTTQVVQYDRLGRIVETVDACGAARRIKRDAAGRIVAVTHPDGRVHRYEYDLAGRWCATISTGGDRYEFHYDVDSNLVGETWPTGDRVTTTFDECARITSRREPGRGLVTIAYDKCGRIIRMRDPFNGPRRFTYDAAGRMTSATNALGGVTRFGYDQSGRQSTVTDPLGGTLTRTFDAAGRVTSLTDAIGRTTTFTWDGLGHLTSRTSPTGTSVAYTWDKGRLTFTTVDGRLHSSSTHDPATRTTRTTMAATGEVLETVLDPVGRLASRTRDGVGVSYGYNASGHRTFMRRPDGSVTTYEHNTNGHITQVHDPRTGTIALERDALGRVTSIEGEGLTASFSYTGAGLESSVINRGGFIQRTSSTRDDDDRVVAHTVDGITVSYSFDEAGQLASATSSEGHTTHYSWDAAGRLAEELTNGHSTTYHYDAAGQLLSSKGPAGSVHYTYDAQGRRTAQRAGSTERRYSWDHRSYLTAITDIDHDGDTPAVRRTPITVDAGGELATVGTQDVYWDSAAGLPTLAAYGANIVVDAFAATSVHATAAEGTWLIPGIDPDLDLTPQPAAAHAVAGGAVPSVDGVPGVAGASVAGLSEVAGSGVSRPALVHDALPLGITAGATPTLDGAEWMGRRVLDPATHAFLSPDPLRPVLGSAWVGNPYSYAGNNPVTMSDPLGLSPVTEAELRAYADSNNGVLHNTAQWVGDNWEYIAAGAMIIGGIAVMCTGVGGPVGAAMIAGGLFGGGGSIGVQKWTTGKVDWGKVGVDTVIGTVSGLAGGGAGTLLRNGTTQMTNCLGRNILVGTGESIVEGGVSNALNYVTGPGPHTASGLFQATTSSLGMDALLGAGGGALDKFTGASRIGCFTADTPVLMADGTSKPISDVAVGDEVSSVDPATGETVPAMVENVLIHEDVPTMVVTTSDGTIETTATHPFYVQGYGFTPAEDLREGDRLRSSDGQEITVVAIEATGQTHTVYNLTTTTHTYHVHTENGVAVLVHNECGTGGADTPGSGGGSGGHGTPPGGSNNPDGGEFPDWNGRVTFGELNEHGQATGMSAIINGDMLTHGTKANSSIEPPGWDGPNLFDRGHLLANVLGGTGDDPRNLVTMLPGKNRGQMRVFEERVRQLVEEKGEVLYTATPIYDDTGKPILIELEAITEDGIHIRDVIDNSGPPRRRTR
ncbi:MAG: polymorphic toxin-type HINT domain-containing protein [Actinomycetaceae bacterium]|nr:polymorphic toxin-type HINT domain-containing protein [Actinomycetaceae bacterium]